MKIVVTITKDVTGWADDEYWREATDAQIAELLHEDMLEVIDGATITISREWTP